MSREEVLDALLAYGWIDGRRYALDENQTMQLVCKRKQQKWTQSYRQRIEQLTANGLMKPSGLKSVEQLNQMATGSPMLMLMNCCLLYTSDAADD